MYIIYIYIIYRYITNILVVVCCVYSSTICSPRCYIANDNPGCPHQSCAVVEPGFRDEPCESLDLPFLWLKSLFIMVERPIKNG